jgi:hypothetical protein
MTRQRSKTLQHEGTKSPSVAIGLRVGSALSAEASMGFSAELQIQEEEWVMQLVDKKVFGSLFKSNR